MKILAIETATEACSAALLQDDKVISRFQIAPREHTRLLLPMMEEVLEEENIELKELDAIAFSRGPGAFTGLRIAAGVAQGVALSINKPVIQVSTLSALALQAYSSYKVTETIIAALDARMGEVYWATFAVKDGDVVLVGEENISKPEIMLAAACSFPEQRVAVIGTGWDAYEYLLFKADHPRNFHFIKQQYPCAEAIVKLAMPLYLAGKSVSPENAQPVYIRNKVAEKSVQKFSL